MRIQIIMMQKNEDDLLLPWLKHHGALIGYQNLLVFDNGSDSQATKATLDWAEKLGVRVDRRHTLIEDFVAKGDLYVDTIRQMESSDQADFYFPVDCDEFLVTKSASGVSSDKEALDLELAQYQGSTHPLRIFAGLDNNPMLPGYFFWSLSQRKTFFAAGACDVLDHGFHVGQSRDRSSPVRTKVVYVHYHYKPFHILVEHSKQKLRPFTNDFSVEGMRKYMEEQREGFHCAAHLTRSEAEYYAAFNPANYVEIPEVKDMFAKIGEPLPFLREYERLRRNTSFARLDV